MCGGLCRVVRIWPLGINLNGTGKLPRTRNSTTSVLHQENRVNSVGALLDDLLPLVTEFGDHLENVNGGKHDAVEGLAAFCQNSFRLAVCGFRLSKSAIALSPCQPPVPVVQVERQIHLIRGWRVMLDRDLAALYGVPTFGETKPLNGTAAGSRKTLRFSLHGRKLQL